MLVFVAFMAGRLPRLTCLACAAVLLGMARQGYAQLEYHLSAGSSAGVSNISGAQSGGTAAGQTDALLVARAGAEFGYTGRLTQNQAAYQFAATWWVRGTQSTSLSHILNLSSVIQTSAATKLTLAGNATLSQLSLADTTVPADPQNVGARPGGNQEFINVGAFEAFTWQMAAMWRLEQMLDGRIYRRLGGESGSSQNESLTNSLGIIRSWLRDQAGLRTRVGVMQAGAPAGQSLIASRQSEFGEVLLSWGHQWTPAWTSELGAGVFLLHVPGNYVGPTPAASATVAYRYAGYELDIHGARTAEPNVYVGSALERNLVSLRAAVPIGRYQSLRLDAMANVEHDASAGIAGGPPSTANILILQTGANYQPSKMLMCRLQYTFRDQFSTSDASGTSPFSAFRQHMAMFTIEVRYPTATPPAPRSP